MSSARPEPKRVRSDQDHSKADTQDREDKKKQSKGKKSDSKENGDGDEHNHKPENGEGKKDEDEDWLNKPPFSVGLSWDDWEVVWRQSCWCGKTAFVYNHDPLQAKICHCEDCQRLHGAPYQHAAVFKKDMVRLDCKPEWVGFLSAHGEVHPLSSTPTPIPHKVSCRACGSPLFDEGRNMIMAFPPTFEWPRTNKEVEAHGNSKADDPEAGKEEGKEENSHDAGGKGHKTADGKWKKPGLPEVFRPQCHIFYERRVVDVNDGLIKWRGHKDTEKMGDTDR